MSANHFQILTYRDAVEQLLDSVEARPSRKGRRNARRALEAALRELPHVHDWHYYRRPYKLSTDAPYATGTVAYTAATRQLVLTGGTWPSWARWGQLHIGSQLYDVERDIDSTTLVLKEATSPADDFTGQTYTLSRAVYPLPADVQQVSTLIELGTGYELSIEPADYYLSEIRSRHNPKRPNMACVMGDARATSGLVLRLGPAPSTERSYDMLYSAKPWPLLVEGYSTGTVSVTAGSRTVTGVGTTFVTSHLRSCFRISSTASIPTDVVGYIDEGEASGELINPFAFQSIVESVESGTSLLLQDPAPDTLSGKAYLLSDPVDVENGSMREYYMRLAELKFAELSQYPAADIQLRKEREVAALRRAASADNRDRDWNATGNSRYWWRLSDWGDAS